MKSPWTKAIELTGIIFAIGIRAILISLAIEFVLLIAACGIGAWVWLQKDLLAGFAAGLIAFVVGQALVAVVLDAILDLPEREADKTRLPSDDEVINSLKSELMTNADSKNATKRPAPGAPNLSP